MPYLKTITSSLWIKQGSQYENESNNGISHFMEHILFDLGRSPQGKKIHSELNKYGAQLNALTTKEFICFHMTTMDKHNRFRLAIESLYNTVTLPISEEAFNREKQIVLNEIKTSNSNKIMQDCIYALWDNYSIGLPVLGKEAIVENISFEEMNRFFSSNINPSNSFLVILGNVGDIQSTLDIVKEYFVFWKNSLSKITNRNICVKSGSRIVKSKTTSNIVSIALGFNGFNFNNPYSRILEFIGLLLTDGISSRIYQNLRVEKKLIYSVRSSNYSFASAGAFIITCSFEKAYFGNVIKNILKEINMLKNVPVSHNEIEETAERFITKLNIELEKPASLANFIGRYYALGKIFSYYDYFSEILDINEKNICDISNMVFNDKQIAFAGIGDYDDNELLTLLSNEL